MLGFVQNWIAPKANPIGVDFGSVCLRMAQVQWTGSEHKLVAAASADVPSHLRIDPVARLHFFVETTRDLLAQGAFKGRAAVLGLPAAWMHIQHLRMPKLDEEALKKALPWEARGKLPIDPSQALIRHLVAGDVYQDQDPKMEVIVMAAKRELVNQFLASAARAKLDVVGMNIEPKALLDCFSFVHRRKGAADVTHMFVDIGCSSTRAMVTRGGHILFARAIPVGGDHFNRAVSQALKITADDARLLRIKLCHQQPMLEGPREHRVIRAEAVLTAPLAAAATSDEPTENSFALLSAGMEASRKQVMGLTGGAGDKGAAASAIAEAATAVIELPAAPSVNTDQFKAVEQACMEPLAKLVEELDLCRRYYEATFANSPVERLLFVGGEARQRTLCQHIARGLGLAAQVGDPMVRMARTSEISIESGIDRRLPQPTWAVAIGLSMGPGTGSGQ